MTRFRRSSMLLIALAGMTAVPALAAVFVSDDFSGTNLNTQLWSLEDPVGGASFVLANKELKISIPGGVDHDIWSTGNDSTRIMQATDNVDFEIEVKFSTVPTQQYQMEGILVRQDAGDFIRFDLYSDGVSLHAFAAPFTGGSPVVTYDNSIVPGGNVLYMRVTRVGDQWTQSYSSDGANWTAVTIFNHVLNTVSVGPFVGNAGASPGSAPAFTGSIDYFFNTDSPIDPEDGGVAPPDTTPPFIYNESVVAVSDVEISASWNTDEVADGVLEYGLTTSYELGTLSDPALTTDHSFSITNLQPDTTYQVRLKSTDAAGNVSFSGNHSVYTSALPVFDIWYGANQAFGVIGQAQPWVNILGNVSDPDGIASLTYSLNGQPALPLTIGPNSIRLIKPGDFNAEISFNDLVVGQNNIVITAQDSLGFEKVETVTVDYPGENHLPLNYSIDWSTVANIQDVAQIVDGLWTLEGSSIRPLEVGYDRLIAIGDEQWQNYEVTVPITVHGLDPICKQQWCSGGGPFVGVLARWPGHYVDEFQPYTTWWPMGVLGGVKWYDENYNWMELFRGSDGVIVDQDFSIFLPLEVPHMFKVRAETTASAHHYQVKMWPQSDPEPTEWNFTIDEPLTETSSGSVLLIAHHVDASFGNVVVTNLDDQTPPVISNIFATTGKVAATIYWETDEPSTSAVAYGKTTDYELGTVSDSELKTSHKIVVTDLWSNTNYHYQISSTDGSGNTVTSADQTFKTKSNFVYVCGGCHQQ